MSEGYSLGDHRGQEELDHAVYSILNKYTYPQARTYKAIVDPAGFGDLTDIQDAIDYVAGIGGGSIFIKNGTYTLTADLVIPSNIQLQGESMEGVKIYFAGGDYQVLVQGTANTSPTGTITATKGDETIVGAGTDFDPEVTAGDYIRINDAWYKVASVTDDTNLELTDKYSGVTQAGLTFDIMDPIENVKLDDFTITNSGDNYGLEMQYVRESFVNNVKVQRGSKNGFKFSWMFDCSVTNIYSNNNTWFGILITECQTTYFEGLSAISNSQTGIYISGETTAGVVVLNSNSSNNGWYGVQMIVGTKITLLAVTAVGNGSSGFWLNGAEYPVVQACHSEANGVHGFVLESGTDYGRLFMNTSLNNNNWGIDVHNGSSKNVIVGNVSLGNGDGNYQDNGQNTVQDNNIFA